MTTSKVSWSTSQSRSKCRKKAYLRPSHHGRAPPPRHCQIFPSTQTTGRARNTRGAHANAASTCGGKRWARGPPDARERRPSFATTRGDWRHRGRSASTSAETLCSTGVRIHSRQPNRNGVRGKVWTPRTRHADFRARARPPTPGKYNKRLQPSLFGPGTTS